MIRILCIAALLLAAPAALAAQHHVPEFCPDGYTQRDMNACAADAWALADSILNDTYQQVIRTLGPERVGPLRAAQRAWIRFRDAECAFQASRFGGGSMAPMTEALCRAALTHRRTEDLVQVLNEDEAG